MFFASKQNLDRGFFWFRSCTRRERFLRVCILDGYCASPCLAVGLAVLSPRGFNITFIRHDSSLLFYPYRASWTGGRETTAAMTQFFFARIYLSVSGKGGMEGSWRGDVEIAAKRCSASERVVWPTCRRCCRYGNTASGAAESRHCRL